MRTFFLLAAVIGLLLCSGCKTEDVLSYVGGANAYIGDVGANMRVRGWSDFPTNAIDWYRWSADLRESVAAAKSPTSNTAMVSSMGAMAAVPLKQGNDPPMDNLGDAFGRKGNW